MSVKDALLFIDANKYLDLYRTDKGRKLLGPLAEQASYVFVTQQVVDEVERNKLGAAAEFLRTKNQGMKLHGINVPDHFSGSEAGKNDEILKSIKSISKSVSTVNAEIDLHTLEILAQVSESKDEVSKELASIFSGAVTATPDELRRARERKEVGNPPGKRNDPLGDEITWEQILSNFKRKKRLWIISRDGDYGTEFGGKFFLNGLLRSEVMQVSESASVYIFKDLFEGLKHFVETTKVKAEVKLTPEEVADIEAEEKSLPIEDATYHASTFPEYARSSVDTSQALAAMQSSAEIQRALDAIRSSADIQRALDAIRPSAEIQRALDAIRPSADIQRALDAIRPSAEIQRALDAISPSTETQRVLDAIKFSTETQSFLDAKKRSSDMPKDEDE